MQPDDVLVYIHIPKTAGTSMIRFLDSKFPEWQIFPVHSLREAQDRGGVSLSFTSQYRFVRGHYRFGPFDGAIFHHLAQNPILITMMRDPIERTISSYRHILRHPENILHDEVLRDQVTLYEYVTQPRFANRIINHQSRQIAGSFSEDSADWASLDPKRERILFRLAWERICQCAFVGVTERFDDSLKMLAWTFGWQLDNVPPRENAAPSPTKKEEFSEKEIEAIQRVNSVDLRLYGVVVDLFEERWQALREGE